MVLAGFIMQQENCEKSRDMSREAMNKKVGAIFKLLKDMYGADKLVLKAAKFEALNYIRSKKIEKRVLGLQRMVFEDPTLSKDPGLQDIPDILIQLEDRAAETLARRSLDESIEQKISYKLQEKHEQYIQEVRKQLLKEETGPENSQTLKKYAQLEKKWSKGLSRSAMEFLRPATLSEIIGQDSGIAALMSKLASPFPQHIILYGPPGVGKTAAARLALQAAKDMQQTPFQPDAPFIEVDGTTLRWDPRETTNPLLGSVHDPIYQGAKKDFSDDGIPEPKPGLVTEAHAGVLFIDEIGEMDNLLQNKLLKVLEDKKVSFDSSYYDPSDTRVPKYVHKLFEDGAPADFILIGATTRHPEHLPAALRSRCSAVYFEPLSPEDIKKIVINAAEKLHVDVMQEAADTIARYTSEGRKAVSILADAYGMALYTLNVKEKRENQGKNTRSNRSVSEENAVMISAELVQEAIRGNRMTPLGFPNKNDTAQIGRILALAASGYLGSVLEVEAVAFPATEQGRGKIRFNEAAGKMARDSVFNATTVLRSISGLDIENYDLHINIVGGANVDGPSAGAALFLAIYSTLKGMPVRQDIAVSGELSLQGKLKPVGGLLEKIYGARVAGVGQVVLPEVNRSEILPAPKDIEVVYVNHVEDLISIFHAGGETI